MKHIDNTGRVHSDTDDESWEAMAEAVHVAAMRLIETHWPKCVCDGEFPNLCDRCWRLEELKSLLKNPNGETE